MIELKPKDLVCIKGGIVARVLELLDDGRVMLDHPDGPKPYVRVHLKLIGQPKPPRGNVRVPPSAVEALRLRMAGQSRTAIASRMGVGLKTVESWIRLAREGGTVP